MTGTQARAGGPVVVRSLAQALMAATAAASASVPLDLVSAAGCDAAAGTSWFAALGDLVAAEFPDLPLSLTLDCADRPGRVLGALRHGLKSIIFTGDPAAAARLDQIAAQTGAAIRRDRPHALDLATLRNPGAACAGWFTPNAGAALG